MQTIRASCTNLFPFQIVPTPEFNSKAVEKVVQWCLLGQLQPPVVNSYSHLGPPLLVNNST